MKNNLIFLISFLFVISAQAAIKTEVVDYVHGKVKLQGLIAYDDSIQGQRPGVLVVHEWWGHGDFVRERAQKLAEMGYIAFALDMYGTGIYAKDHAQAAALSGPFRKDNQLMVDRALVGLKILRNHKLTNNLKVAAIGYCFGGSTVLGLARVGTDLAAVASFHGGLGTNLKVKPGQIKAKVLVLHGASDSFSKDEDVLNFQKEMNDAKADWQMNLYGGAVHSFTVKTAGDDPSKGMAYNESADHRSWEALTALFGEIF